MAAADGMSAIAEFNFSDSSVVKLEISQDEGEATTKKTFPIHEQLLRDASPVLAAALDGHFQESKTKVYVLADTDETTANRLVQWLYCRKFSAWRVEQGSAQDYYSEAFNLYICASKYMIENLLVMIEHALAQTIMDFSTATLTPDDKGQDLPSLEIIKRVYTDTDSSSHIRELLATSYSAHVNPEWYEKESNVAQLAEMPDFTLDIARAFATQKKNSTRVCELHKALNLVECNHRKRPAEAQPWGAPSKRPLHNWNG
ncbi:uncharacterized protein KY384_008614 [Bacidia gigantensis]|uniref:uncharacterized protein n=1 Tax=Bacidia gigantensis TaxID=2732470 RepID=UPI001D037699|nr:uncharacterized protein KY384_008614 [Bacidia gigantensis]KAG8527184.1 hypothetical protein KY384_008614 [Bacidia gigantensis]